VRQVGAGATQTPLLQVLPVGQTLPHAPQLFTSVSPSRSHPFAALPSQFRKPALHAKLHVELAQIADALARAGHTVPHPPQLLGSNAVLVHIAPHELSPLPQLIWHDPAEQTRPAPQAVPQAPQLALSVAKFAQYALAPVPQSERPGPHVVVQTPETHA
jgi:hypothetical protein